MKYDTFVYFECMFTFSPLNCFTLYIKCYTSGISAHILNLDMAIVVYHSTYASQCALERCSNYRSKLSILSLIAMIASFICSLPIIYIRIIVLNFLLLLKVANVNAR